MNLFLNMEVVGQVKVITLKVIFIFEDMWDYLTHHQNKGT